MTNPHRIDHVGVAVEDLDTALAFYRDVLGMHVTHQETNTEQGVHEVMLAPADTADDEQPTLIQLLAPADEEGPIATFLAKRGPGLQQLAFTVNDVQEVARRIGALGIRVLYDAPKAGTAGSLVNFVHPGDTGGVLIELVQPPPAAHLPQP